MNNCAKYHHHTQKCNFLGGNEKIAFCTFFGGLKNGLYKRKNGPNLLYFKCNLKHRPHACQNLLCLNEKTINKKFAVKTESLKKYK